MPKIATAVPAPTTLQLAQARGGFQALQDITSIQMPFKNKVDCGVNTLVKLLTVVDIFSLELRAGPATVPECVSDHAARQTPEPVYPDNCGIGSVQRGRNFHRRLPSTTSRCSLM